MKSLNLLVIGVVFALGGCANYTTPGGPVRLLDLTSNQVATQGSSDKSKTAALSRPEKPSAAGALPNTGANAEINKLLSKEATASFPASISVARVQASGYESHKLKSYGSGRYSVVTTREVESDEDCQRLAGLPQIAGVGPLSRILLPTKLDSIEALRVASARLKADMLLVYTFDTSYRVGAQSYAPLNAIFLGLLSNKKVTVTTTVSAAFFDVRTEYLYGLSEATSQESRTSNVWSTSSTVDELRLVAEKAAFKRLIPAIEKTWRGIVDQYANGTTKG